jgi:hypothetical protein
MKKTESQEEGAMHTNGVQCLTKLKAVEVAAAILVVLFEGSLRIEIHNIRNQKMNCPS